MNCHECRLWIDDLVLRDPDEPPPASIIQHLTDCEDCAREHVLARETLEAITPAGLRIASSRLKERILSVIPDATLNGSPILTIDAPRPALNPWNRPRPRIRPAFAVAAAVVLAMILFPIWLGPARKDGAISLLAQASAVEARLFEAEGVVSVSGTIEVKTQEDAEWVEARWLPMVVVEATGKTRIFQLKLGGDPKEGYTVRDDSWFDPKTGRFAHVLTLKDRPIFANAYDGRSVYLLEVDEQGRPHIKQEPTAKGFQPPRNPALFLGTFAGLIRDFERPDKLYTPHEEGPTKLADGTPARVVRLDFLEGQDTPMPWSALRVIVRDDNRRIESFELVASGKTLFTVRRADADSRPEPRYGWDLVGLRPSVEKGPGVAKSPVQALADLVRPNITVDEMAKRADYPVYVFGRDPAWTSWRQIMDVLDLPSPPHRMFAAVYPAKDRRHVLLVQAHSFNANLGPKVRKGKRLYTSPAGVKVWSDPDGPKMADILLSSTRAAGLFPDATAKDRNAYFLETPEGTLPVLAVNGTLTDAELHGLIDSLVLAKPK